MLVKGLAVKLAAVVKVPVTTTRICEDSESCASTDPFEKFTVEPINPRRATRWRMLSVPTTFSKAFAKVTTNLIDARDKAHLIRISECKGGILEVEFVQIRWTFRQDVVILLYKAKILNYI